MRDERSRRQAPLVIGVTGGIGSGKSTVVEELGRLGAVTYSADAIAREILQPDGPAYQPVVDAFGPEIVRPDGRIDRVTLGERVFRNPDERRRLDALTHPIILGRLRDEIDAFRRYPPNDPPVAAAEIPLLFEAGAESLVDCVLVVALEQDRQFARLKQRSSWPDARIRAAMASQMPLPQKIARADHVISTDGDLPETLAQTRAFWEQITEAFKEDLSCS